MLVHVNTNTNERREKEGKKGKEGKRETGQGYQIYMVDLPWLSRAGECCTHVGVKKTIWEGTV